VFVTPEFAFWEQAPTYKFIKNLTIVSGNTLADAIKNCEANGVESGWQAGEYVGQIVPNKNKIQIPCVQKVTRSVRDLHGELFLMDIISQPVIKGRAPSNCSIGYVAMEEPVISRHASESLHHRLRRVPSPMSSSGMKEIDTYFCTKWGALTYETPPNHFISDVHTKSFFNTQISTSEKYSIRTTLGFYHFRYQIAWKPRKYSSIDMQKFEDETIAVE
jgi:hypothetical protein